MCRASSGSAHHPAQAHREHAHAEAARVQLAHLLGPHLGQRVVVVGAALVDARRARRVHPPRHDHHRARQHDPLHGLLAGRVHDVVEADDVGADQLRKRPLVRLRRQVHDRVHAAHRRLHGAGVRDVGDNRVADLRRRHDVERAHDVPRRPSSSHSGRPTVPAEPVTRTFAMTASATPPPAEHTPGRCAPRTSPAIRSGWAPCGCRAT